MCVVELAQKVFNNLININIAFQLCTDKDFLYDLSGKFCQYCNRKGYFRRYDGKIYKKETNMKKILTLTALLMGIVGFAALGAFRTFSANCERVSGEVLRLHIPANSDGDDDQAVKLKVRDCLLSEFGGLLSGGGLSDAEEKARALLPEIERRASEILLENGFCYGASAELVDMWFETREYERLILPAGNYKALRVTLGSGEGHNWWCVIFPQLCLPAVSECDQNAENVLDSFGKPQKIKVKFAIYEWLENIFG